VVCFFKSTSRIWVGVKPIMMWYVINSYPDAECKWEIYEIVISFFFFFIDISDSGNGAG
jgi:hypothetical protein